MTPDDALVLAEAVVVDGFEAHGAALAGFSDEAVARGVTPLLLDIVADPGDPLVARQRALGRAVDEFCRRPVPSTRPVRPFRPLATAA